MGGSGYSLSSASESGAFKYDTGALGNLLIIKTKAICSNALKERHLNSRYYHHYY